MSPWMMRSAVRVADGFVGPLATAIVRQTGVEADESSTHAEDHLKRRAHRRRMRSR
jgi:hypothetical protein